MHHSSFAVSARPAETTSTKAAWITCMWRSRWEMEMARRDVTSGGSTWNLERKLVEMVYILYWKRHETEWKNVINNGTLGRDLCGQTNEQKRCYFQGAPPPGSEDFLLNPTRWLRVEMDHQVLTHVDSGSWRYLSWLAWSTKRLYDLDVNSIKIQWIHHDHHQARLAAL